MTQIITTGGHTNKICDLPSNLYVDINYTEKTVL